MKRSSQPIGTRYLLPGELACSEEPTLISTVLGSCVAITLFNPRLGVGGMCHAVLPDSKGERNLRYVDRALGHMLEQFEQLGVRRNEIEAKLFGGAEMLRRDDQRPGAGMSSVGCRNIAAAVEAIRKEGLTLAVSEIGGHQGRKLLFYTHTGEALLKKLKQPEM